MMEQKNQGMFQDCEFELACKELEQRQLDGYEYFTESHDTIIYRRYDESSGLYEYKIYGCLAGVPPEVSAEVYMDIEYRRKWDSYVNELVEFKADGTTLLYWNVNYPWPMSNRDYVYARSMKELDHNGQKTYVVLARSEKASSMPEGNGVIRVEDYKQSCVLTSDGKGGSKAYMHYFDNPKGSIPTWLINWAAKVTHSMFSSEEQIRQVFDDKFGTGVPGFLTMMETACKGYPQYLEERQQQQQPLAS